MTWSDRLAPSLDAFALLARQAFDALPGNFHRRAREAVIRVEDFPADEVLDSLGIEDPFELTSLSAPDDGIERSRVLLYRRPILDQWAERGDIGLGQLITDVLVHELDEDAGVTFPVISGGEWADLAAPPLTLFSEVANQSLRDLPPAIRAAIGETRVVVQDFADEDLLAALEIEDPFELTGVYEGVDLTRRSVLDPGPMPSTIRLFRRPILDEWFDADTGIVSLIEHVFVHEVAHHFGFSDADIERVEES